MWLHACGGKTHRLEKGLTSVGGGAGCDVDTGGEEGTWFGVRKDGDRAFLLEGAAKLRCNGRRPSFDTPLKDGDRIEVGDHAFVFLSGAGKPTEGREALATACLELLSKLAAGLGREPREAGLEATLSALVELAAAESGHLVVEDADRGGWSIVASKGVPSGPRERRELLSHTVLGEAIASGRAVHVESLVGHPWAHQESLINARVFSLACLPLRVSGRCFGCVYLYTRTPGRSIRRERLEDLAVLATQGALLLASARPARAETKVSRSVGMQRVQERLEKLAPAELNLIVSGETGTGKELIARSVHSLSRRAAGPFVALNCGALPPTLIESTLFGYRRGAFTGADRDAKGKFVSADGGTLFLDEIGEMPLDVQVKLLRALQERQVEPLGSDKPEAVDIRVVAATHRDLKALVRDGKFREDLYYRLAGAVIEVPPLRERGSEILSLARLFLKERNAELELSEEAELRLTSHRWPGNVRELEQVVARAAALTVGKVVEPEDLEIAADAPADDSELKQARGLFDRETVSRALQRTQGSRAKAAALLGISERTLYRILAADRGRGV